jgi:hypothetical protein
VMVSEDPQFLSSHLLARKSCITARKSCITLGRTLDPGFIVWQARSSRPQWHLRFGPWPFPEATRVIPVAMPAEASHTLTTRAPPFMPRMGSSRTYSPGVTPGVCREFEIRALSRKCNLGR